MWFCGGVDVRARVFAVRSRWNESSEVVGGEVVCSGSLRCARHVLELRAEVRESTDIFRV